MFFNFCAEKKVVDRILSDLFVKKKFIMPRITSNTILRKILILITMCFYVGIEKYDRLVYLSLISLRSLPSRNQSFYIVASNAIYLLLNAYTINLNNKL